MSPERFARRADWETTRGDPGLARLLYLRAAKETQETNPALAMEFLDRALDVCLEYLPPSAEEVRDTALAVLAASDGRDARAKKALGMFFSLLARGAWSRGKADEAAGWFQQARQALTESIELLPEDSDAQATLGGLHRRAAAWHRGDPPTRRQHEEAALAAYEAAASLGSSPYAVLNAIEYGAVVRYTRALDARSSDDAPRPDAQLFVGDAAAVARQQIRLQSALFVREQQFRRRQDRPWPAFDLARGRHYLKPNVPRFLKDLETAVQEAREAARGGEDVWMLHTVAQTFRELCGVGLPIDGLDDGLALLQGAIYDERWAAGDFEATPRPEDYLVNELSSVRSILEVLVSSTREDGATRELSLFIRDTRQRWTIDDEDRFQREVQVFLTAIEPPQKKALRVLWKLAGKSAVGLAMPALVPGATAAKITADLVGELIEHRLKQKAGEEP